MKTPAKNNPPPHFHVRETELCAELGVSKDHLAERRAAFLVKGIHWDYVKKRVLLSDIGALILRGTIACVLTPPGEKDAPTEDSAPKRPPVALLLENNPRPIQFEGKLVAWASPIRNRRLLVAYVPGSDPQNPLNLVSVHVRDNSNFTRGMDLPGPGRSINRVNHDTFELLGACPRARGRW